MILYEQGVRERYNQGIYAATSAAVLALYITQHDIMTEHRIATMSTELVCALSIAIACLTFPRRPAVYKDGRLVDQENGASVISLLSFSWYPFYQHSFHNPDSLSLSDVPITPLAQRIRTVRRNFMQCAPSGVLLSRLVCTWSRSFFLQWALTLLHSMSQHSSQYLLHGLLGCLERPRSQQQHAMGYALCLGLALLLENMSAGWITWVTQAKLYTPMTALLKGLLFEQMTKQQSSRRIAPNAEKGEKAPFLESLISSDWYVFVFNIQHC